MDRGKVLLLGILVLCSVLIPFSTKAGLEDSSLRADANFQVEVEEGVYWVPVNVLGQPELSREELLEFEKSPED